MLVNERFASVCHQEEGAAGASTSVTALGAGTSPAINAQLEAKATWIVRGESVNPEV